MARITRLNALRDSLDTGRTSLNPCPASLILALRARKLSGRAQTIENFFSHYQLLTKRTLRNFALSRFAKSRFRTFAVKSEVNSLQSTAVSELKIENLELKNKIQPTANP
jgi:hypothetical protein